MTTFATMNPVGSTAVKDLYDNAENFDLFSLSPRDYEPDRLNVNRLTMAGIRNQANTALANTGFEDLGDYASAPLTITRRNQVFTYNGQFYAASAALQLPYTTINNWAADSSNFVNRGDAVLRQDLAKPTGANLVGVVDADGNSTTVGAALSNLKTQYLVVDSVAQMLALPDSFLGTVETKSYYGDGKGGGGRYFADAADTSTASNGGTVHVSPGGRRRKLSYSNLITVKQFGARGDNTTDDYAALQRAHDNIPRGVWIYYPLGLYYTTQQVLANGGSNISFASRSTTIDSAQCALVGANGLDGVIKVQSGGNVSSVKIENMVVTRKGATYPNSVRGIILSGIDQTVLIDCASFNHGIPLHVNGQLNPWLVRFNSWRCTLSHVKISNVVEPRFTNCRFGRNGGVDTPCDSYVWIDGGEGLSPDTIDFLACQFNQSGAEVNQAVRITNYSNVNGIINFVDCHAETWSTFFIGLEVTATRVQRISMTNCTISSAGGPQLIGGVMAGVIEDLKIVNCTMAGRLTFDQVISATFASSYLGGDLVINSGNVVATGNRISGGVSLIGNSGKIICAMNQIGGGLTNTHTGSQYVQGNI